MKIFISKIVQKLNRQKKLKPSCSSIKVTFLSLMLLAVNAFSAGTPTYIHSDHLGSPVMATNADGSVKWQKRYQPFGSVMQKEDTDNSVGFTGHVQDKTLDLNYMQARWYNPELGRFLSIDPVGYQDGNTHSFNRYAYANNNPYKYVDPDGQIAKLVKLAWNIGKKAYKNGGDFKKAGKDEWQDIVENAAELLDGDFTSDDVFAAVDLLTGFGKELKGAVDKVDVGVIYRVAGKDTRTGKPYVGSANDLDIRAKAKDGRDRTDAEIIGLYPVGDKRARKKAEQIGIDKTGIPGKRSDATLDNKRNEIAKNKYSKYGL
jgi:RHS repeat-associated protein